MTAQSGYYIRYTANNPASYPTDLQTAIARIWRGSNLWGDISPVYFPYLLLLPNNWLTLYPLPAQGLLRSPSIQNLEAPNVALSAIPFSVI